MKPSVVIVSSSNTKPKSLIKLITKCHDIKELQNEVHTHSWYLETKYYTADVEMIGITNNYKRSQIFNENVEALIIHMDTNKSTGLDDLDVWLEIEQDCTPEIKLLLANYCNNDTKITKAAATEWCCKRGFEFIELYPSEENETEQDIIEEKVGVDRIIEVLQTHTWPNMILKNDKQDVECGQQGEIIGDDVEDDFTDLFAQLSMMKESLQSLPINQRKQCAEQVVTAFWKAIGGAEDEIDDL